MFIFSFEFWCNFAHFFARIIDFWRFFLNLERGKYPWVSRASYDTFWYFLLVRKLERKMLQLDSSCQQDGRLASAFFSPKYKYFDQLLQTLESETTVFNLVFNGFFYKYQLHHWFLYSMQKGGITSFRKIFVSKCRKISVRNTSVFQKISGIEKFYA